MTELTSPLLERRTGYWDGAFQPVDVPTFDVRDPATTDVIARLPRMGAAEATLAIASGFRAFEAGAPALATRRRTLLAIADAHETHADELARIITAENGKPHGEALGEVRYAAAFYREAERHVDRLAPRTLEERPRGLTWRVHARPAGVAALITPFNFPLAMLAKKLSAALAAGCPVVVKPAEKTPLAAVALFSLLARLDLPPGTVNLVFGDPQPIGQALCAHPDVRVISFTGSTAVGQWLAAACAPYMKRLSLELGGNAPFLVFADADLDHAADQLLNNKLRSAGQTCVCANRVLVDADVVEAFADRVAQRVGALRVGPGADPASNVGPLIDRAAFDKVQRHIRDALDRGARALFGGVIDPPADGAGAFHPPTVLTGVPPDALAAHEETFGPLIAITAFSTEEEALSLAAATRYGLAAYAFSADPERLERVAARLRFGHVGLNSASGPTPEAPFGGMRMSGVGREGGEEGMLEYVEWQTTPIGP